MVDVLKSSEGERGDVLLVAVGPFASLALEIAERLDKQGISVAVVDPRCRVKGIDRLWVVDGSVLPRITSRGPQIAESVPENQDAISTATP